MNIENTIERLKQVKYFGINQREIYIDEKNTKIFIKDLDTVLNELGKKDKVIDEMAECIYEIAKIKPMTVDKLLGDKICLWEDCDNINREVNCDYCIKEYFYKRASEE